MDRWTSGGNEVLECRRSVRMETYSFPGKERLGHEVDHSAPLVPRPGMTSCISECEWHK